MLEDLIEKTKNDLSRKARWSTRLEDLKGLNQDLKKGNVENLMGEDISQSLNNVGKMLDEKNFKHKIQESFRSNRDWFSEYKTVIEMYERKERAKDGRSQKVNPHDLSLRALDSILKGDVYKTYSKRFNMADDAIGKIGEEICELRVNGHEKRADELSYQLVTKVSNYIGQNENLDRKEDLKDIESHAMDYVDGYEVEKKLIKQAQEGKFDQRGNPSKRARRAAQERADKMRRKWGYDIEDQNETNEPSPSEDTQEANEEQEGKFILRPDASVEESESSSQEDHEESLNRNEEIVDVTGDTIPSQGYTKRRSWFNKKSMGIVAAGVLALVGGGVYLADHLTDQDQSNTAIEEEQSVNGYFPYSFSPLEKYAEIEENILKDLGLTYKFSPRTEKVREFGDELVNRVRNTLRSEYDIEGNVSEAVNWVGGNQSEERDELMKVIANSLEDMGVFYSEEGLLSRAFDDDLHNGGGVHADCDLLTYFFLHVCEDLGVPANARMNVNHIYLTVQNNPDSVSHVYEPTAFRKQEEIRRDGKLVGVDRGGHGIGEEFYSSFNSQRERSSHLVEDFVEQIGLHEIKPNGLSPEEMVIACIKNDVYSSLANYATKTGDEELERKVMDKFKEDIRNEEQTYLSVQNFYNHHVNKTVELKDSGDYEKAQDHLEEAKWVKNVHSDLFFDGEPKLKYLEAKLNLEERDFEELRDVLSELRQHYSQKDGYENFMDQDYALNEYHAGTLLMSAIAEDMSKSEAKWDYLAPAVNQLSQHRGWKQEYGPLVEEVQEKYGISSI